MIKWQVETTNDRERVAVSFVDVFVVSVFDVEEQLDVENSSNDAWFFEVVKLTHGVFVVT